MMAGFNRLVGALIVVVLVSLSLHTQSIAFADTRCEQHEDIAEAKAYSDLVLWVAEFEQFDIKAEMELWYSIIGVLQGDTFIKKFPNAERALSGLLAASSGEEVEYIHSLPISDRIEISRELSAAANSEFGQIVQLQARELDISRKLIIWDFMCELGQFETVIQQHLDVGDISCSDSIFFGVEFSERHTALSQLLGCG